jgi:hypothetical protein
MSSTTDVIEAARKLVANSCDDYHRTVGDADFEALDAALKAYDARRAELKSMPINGGG